MTLHTLVIGNKNYSSWSLRPWLFMTHFNVPFTEKWVSLFVETTKAALSDYDSHYKVPVMVVSEEGKEKFVIWDSMAIMEYISESLLNGSGWPQDKKARAIARSVSYEIHSSFSALRSAMPMNCRKTFNNIPLSEETSKDIERVKALWRKCRNNYHKQGDWLFGEFSIADAMFAPIVLRFKGYGIALDGIEADYAQTMLDHPAIQEWIVTGRAEKEIINQDEAGY